MMKDEAELRRASQKKKFRESLDQSHPKPLIVRRTHLAKRRDLTRPFLFNPCGISRSVDLVTN